MATPQSSDAIRQLHERVVGLKLRIEKNTYATPDIVERARSLGASLEELRRKLRGRPSQATIDFVLGRLLTIQQELRALSIEELNPLMVQTDGPS